MSLRKPSTETQNFRCLQRFQKEDQRQRLHDTHGEPKADTDRQTPADDAALGFGPPESSCLPVAGSPYRVASTAHQTRGRERNFPPCRAGCLPARPPASALRRLERPVRPPFIESLLLHQIPSCFQGGLGFTLDFPVLPEHRCFYLSFPSVLEVFSSPGQGILDEPPNVLPDVRIPEREERRLPRQCNSQKGKFITDSSQGFLLQPTQWCRVRKKPRAPAVP